VSVFGVLSRYLGFLVAKRSEGKLPGSLDKQAG